MGSKGKVATNFGSKIMYNSISTDMYFSTLPWACQSIQWIWFCPQTDRQTDRQSETSLNVKFGSSSWIWPWKIVCQMNTDQSRNSCGTAPGTKLFRENLYFYWFKTHLSWYNFNMIYSKKLQWSGRLYRKWLTLVFTKILITGSSCHIWPTLGCGSATWGVDLWAKISQTYFCTCQFFKSMFWDCYKNLAFCNMNCIIRFINFKNVDPGVDPLCSNRH